MVDDNRPQKPNCNTNAIYRPKHIISYPCIFEPDTHHHKQNQYCKPYFSQFHISTTIPFCIILFPFKQNTIEPCRKQAFSLYFHHINHKPSMHGYVMYQFAYTFSCCFMTRYAILIVTNKVYKCITNEVFNYWGFCLLFLVLQRLFLHSHCYSLNCDCCCHFLWLSALLVFTFKCSGYVRK